MRLLTHFPSYFLIYDCLCPHPFHETKKDYRLLPLSALSPCPDGCPPAHDLPFRLRKEVRNNDVFILPLQLERVLNARNLVHEEFVGGHALVNLGAAVDHRRVVSATEKLTDSRCRHLGVFLCEIHRHLTRFHIFTLAASAVDGCHGD